MGCLSQTANENRFARFLNNRNITPFTADIRKEEKLILLFTQSLGMPLYKGDSSYRMKSFGLFHCLISFVLNQLAIEGKASLRYREDDGRGRESGLNRTAKMRGLEELAETDKVLTVTNANRVRKEMTHVNKCEIYRLIILSHEV